MGGGRGGFQLYFSKGAATAHLSSFEYFERIWRKGLCFMKREKNKRDISHFSGGGGRLL